MYTYFKNIAKYSFYVYSEYEVGTIMKKVLLLFAILFVSVMTTACINNLAIQELNNKAVKYMDNGDSETAICRLKSSLDLDDEIYETHYNLAIAYTNIGKYEEAVEELNKVLKLKPEFVDAIYTMAVAKDAIAYQIIEKDQVIGSDDKEVSYSVKEMDDFNTKAAEVVELYNKYLVKKIDAEETEQVNKRIDEINAQIKTFMLKLNALENNS